MSDLPSNMNLMGFLQVLQDLVRATNSQSPSGSLADVVEELTIGVNNASGVTTAITPISWHTNLTTTSAQIVGSNTSTRAGLLFHNPGTINLYICPATDHTGNPFSATVAGAGTYLLQAGQSLPLTGLCSNAWNGIAASGSNPITVLEFLR